MVVLTNAHTALPDLKVDPMSHPELPLDDAPDHLPTAKIHHMLRTSENTARRWRLAVEGLKRSLAIHEKRLVREEKETIRLRHWLAQRTGTGITAGSSTDSMKEGTRG